jgi:conjugal transfer pilus assembly protein TraL
MDEYDHTYIPSHLDDAWKLLWFDIEAVLAFSVIFCMGIIANQMKFGAILGILVGALVQKFKGGKHPGFSTHLAYWYLPDIVVRTKRTPPSHQREMIG